LGVHKYIKYGLTIGASLELLNHILIAGNAATSVSNGAESDVSMRHNATDELTKPHNRHNMGRVKDKISGKGMIFYFNVVFLSSYF
jgi:hypothetical protein